MKTVWLLVISLLSLSSFAWAQGCPSGIPSAGNPSCIPPDQQHSPYYQGNQNHSPQLPQPKWATRWGAIATDNERASLGTAVGMRSKREAKKAALADCRSKGGKRCEIDLAYFNQCAVMVLGNKKYGTHGAATIAEATQTGMEKCNQTDTNCRVYYSDCSYPERTQ